MTSSAQDGRARLSGFTCVRWEEVAIFIQTGLSGEARCTYPQTPPWWSSVLLFDPTDKCFQVIVINEPMTDRRLSCSLKSGASLPGDGIKH